MLGRVWRIVADGVDGLKTLIVAGMMASLGLAGYFEAVNLQPVFQYLFGDDVATKMMIFMPVIFATLRWLSSGPLRWTKDWHKDRGTYIGTGNVDEPKAERGVVIDNTQPEVQVIAAETATPTASATPAVAAPEVK